MGKTQLKITDSHLQLQRIKGISLSLKPQVEGMWDLRGISIEGISVQVEDQMNANKVESALFGKPEIVTSYMRSCLLSPKFYSVVNKVLT